MSLAYIESKFPRAKGQISITSPIDNDYNCIAWAANDTANFWWPVYPGYWPPYAPVETTLNAFHIAYAGIGYAICDHGDIEAEFEKIAIFVDGAGVPTHAARQLRDGKWTSKLGRGWDISHNTCDALEGHEYGTVGSYMKRQMTGGPLAPVT